MVGLILGWPYGIGIFNENFLHIITNFSGVGGAEMMLARLIEQTQDECEHVIISLMKVSDVYKSTLEQCHAYYALD